MWMEKLVCGVLRILTPLGPRYVRPSFRYRLYLLWIFRNFDTLPPQVLSPRQQRIIDGLCSNGQFIGLHPFDDASVIGTLERRPTSEKKPVAGARVAGAVSRMGAGLRQEQ